MQNGCDDIFKWTRQAMKMDAASHENGRGKPRKWTRQATSVQGASGIGAASFCSAAEKDIAESPTAIAGTPYFLMFRV